MHQSAGGLLQSNPTGVESGWMMEKRVESFSRPMAPSYHAHAPAVPLPLALPLLALGPGFEKMFRANISTQH